MGCFRNGFLGVSKGFISCHFCHCHFSTPYFLVPLATSQHLRAGHEGVREGGRKHQTAGSWGVIISLRGDDIIYKTHPCNCLQTGEIKRESLMVGRRKTQKTQKETWGRASWLGNPGLAAPHTFLLPISLSSGCNLLQISSSEKTHPT